MNYKYKSRRFWIAIWAILMSSTIMILSLSTEFEPQWMTPTLPLLLSIVLAFVGIESWKKPRPPLS